LPKCNRCTDPFEIWEWKKVDDRWKLHNPYSGSPHACKGNVKFEISGIEKPKKKKSGREWSKNVGDYKSGDLATPDHPVMYSCNKCGDELGIKSFELEGITNIDELLYLKKTIGDEYHCDCIRHLNSIVCKRFCFECNREAQSYTCGPRPELTPKS
jgi:hypothetical protein